MPYYVFFSSDTWQVPNDVSTCDVIIVGGGGASGSGLSGGLFGWPGGGGAGGVVISEGISVIPGANLSVTVGAGGVFSGVLNVPHTDGSPSSFAGLTALGGGRGQRANNTMSPPSEPATGGGSGGSGGGGVGARLGGPDTSNHVGGSGTQGSSGGSGTQGETTDTNNCPGAGGGGAKAPGQSMSPDSRLGGNGGNGYTLKELGWWDQDSANAMNPLVTGNVDVDGRENAVQYSPGAWPVGTVVYDEYPWRLFVARQDLVNDVNGPPFGPESNANWVIFRDAIGGGGGGFNDVSQSAIAEPGIGGGGAGGRPRAIGSGDGAGAVSGTGGGGSGGGAFTGTSVQNNGGSGIVIIRAPSLIAVDCGEVGLDQIVYDLARRAGIPPGRIDVAAIAPDSDYPAVWGIGIGRPASARGIIEIAQRYGFFDLADIGGRLIASRRDRLPNGSIGGDDLRGHVYGETPPTIALREREEDYELPRQIRVQYSQSQAEYEPGVEGYSRRVTDADTVVDVDLSAIAMDPDRAAIIAEVATVEAIVHREITDVTLVATPANKDLKPGDIKTLVIGDRQDVVRIIEMGYTYPGLIKLKVVRHDPSVYHTDAVGAGRRLFGSVIFNPGETEFELLDAPLIREHDDQPGYFAALGGNPTIAGLIEGWPGGDLKRREPSGWEDIAQVLRPGSVFGSAINHLLGGEPGVPLDQELLVTVNAPLEQATIHELCLGKNLAALECTGGWELIRFMTATFDQGTSLWVLTGLVRGVHGTEWASGLHFPGNRFIVLDGEVQIFTDLATELNLSRLHNAATIGQEADPADEVSFAWTGVDRIPYAPAHLAAERDTSDDILLTWFRRDRIGRELQSGQTLPLSESSEAYEVDIYDTDGTTVLRTISVSSPEATYTSAQQTTDFGSLPTELDWDVRQMGQLGRGYARRITSEGL